MKTDYTPTTMWLQCVQWMGIVAIAGLLSSCQAIAPLQEAIRQPTASMPAPEFASWMDSTWALSEQLSTEARSNELLLAQATEDVTGPPAPDLWRNIRKRMLLDHYTEHKRVQQEIAWLQRNPGYLMRLQPRIQRYLPYIFEQTQLHGLPAEIALLPIVESALDPFAFSPGGASGPWQFIRGTARQYGLQINDWYDGRRDVIASTKSAIAYLVKLEDKFDDWYLALAGYNAGEGNVAKALRKRPGSGFFELHLPRETQAYVPRLLALADVVTNPDKYGLTLPQVSPDVQLATLNTHSQFDLSKLSRITEIGLDDLYQYNPALNQWATPPKGPHRIIVPVSLDLTAAQKAIDELSPTQRVDWTEVVIRPGDTLSHIAKRNGTDVASIRRANNLRGHKIRAGKKLFIPKNPQALSHVPRKSRGVMSTHRVQGGDSLWSISRKYDVGLTSLMRANDLGPKDTLSVGREIVLPGITDTNERSVVRKVHYKVRNGDSLARIATKFKVSIQEITNWNNLDPQRYLQPGQGILLYINVIGG